MAHYGTIYLISFTKVFATRHFVRKGFFRENFIVEVSESHGLILNEEILSR